MHRDVERDRATLAALLPITLIAVGVLLLALFVHGNRTGTIVVQRIVEPLSHRFGPQVQISFTTVTETSANGRLDRILVETSVGRSSTHVYGSALVGDTLEQYVWSDNTVYVMSRAAYRTAMLEYLKRRFPNEHTNFSEFTTYAGSWLAPGPRSFFKLQFERGNYLLEGQTRIDGRRVLKFVPAPGRDSIAFAQHSSAQMALFPVDVLPGSDNPVEEVANGTVRYRWSEYRVLPATDANQRLLSLSAQHPGARVSYSATAYARTTIG